MKNKTNNVLIKLVMHVYSKPDILLLILLCYTDIQNIKNTPF